MLLDLAAALTPAEALVALHERADHYDCDVVIEDLRHVRSPYAYAVKLCRRDSARTVVAGHAAYPGALGQAVSNTLALMPS